jgi:hypothetical protein
MLGYDFPEVNCQMLYHEETMTEILSFVEVARHRSSARRTIEYSPNRHYCTAIFFATNIICFYSINNIVE